MSSFLGELAESLLNRYGDKLGELRILFPSRRARLFFIEELSQRVQKPIWQPHWITIDSQMSAIAQIEAGEPIRLIAELYTIYAKHHPTESFDKFYFWGEIMLGDFDMIDKYMIDAKQLFRNINDIKELESDVSYLSDAQQRIISFWSSIGSGEELSRSKQHFLKIWNSLLPIYNEYRERLTELAIGYPGLIYREAVNRLKDRGYECSSIDPNHTYIVAGFNALSECEKELLRELKSRANVEFHWDRDDYYTIDQGQEAGLFLRDNITKFPSADPAITHNNFAQPKHVEVISCSSSALQCKYVAQILEQIAAHTPIDRRTAIVLTDEGLLLPLLYALPESIGGVNVTMGYPIRQTLAYSFVERLLELQQRSREGNLYHVDVTGLLSHPYIDSLGCSPKSSIFIEKIERERLIRVPSELFKGSELEHILCRSNATWSDLSSYLCQTLERVSAIPIEVRGEGDKAVDFIPYLADQITTLHNTITECGIAPSVSTYSSLLRRHLQSSRVPFEGEPLEGLQVMGILESRNLDFDNVIILSMNDDNFPSNRTTQPSYIPYNLRAAYGLPTPEHHDGVYAYYFYRLIQRSNRLYMLYCSRADERSTGEQSRYITQLEYESQLPIERINVGVDVNMVERQPLEIAKEGRVAEELARYMIPQDAVANNDTKRYDGYKQLSPTLLSTYIACPMKFYFKYLASIVKEREVEERIDAPTFGNILHGAMQSLYTPYIGASQIPEMSDQRISAAIEEQINNIYQGSTSNDLSGEIALVRNVVFRYIKDGVLRYDRAAREFVIEMVEGVVLYDIARNQSEKISIRGLCDRVDRVDDGWRIVDYKTGRPHMEFNGVEMLFEGKSRSEFANIFQILLYCYMSTRSGAVHTATPALYYVMAMNEKSFSPSIVDKSDDNDLLNHFGEHLTTLIDGLFNLEKPFEQCAEEERTCEYCDYRTLCSR